MEITIIWLYALRQFCELLLGVLFYRHLNHKEQQFLQKETEESMPKKNNGYSFAVW